jgi:hypothetical protein
MITSTWFQLKIEDAQKMLLRSWLFLYAKLEIGKTWEIGALFPYWTLLIVMLLTSMEVIDGD